MKKIKVFLASSEELRSERLEFANMIGELNDLWDGRIQIKLVKWECLDASMSVEHKQTEYNREVKDSDLVVVLYYSKFGEYTKSELDTAYEGLKSEQRPRKLYVYFKEPTDSRISHELKAFKESFAEKYGHFYCKFENPDTLKLHFLMQFELLDNKGVFDQKSLEVKDSKVCVDGKPIVDLCNIPFASLNHEFVRLSDQIAKQQQVYTKAESKAAKYPDDPDFESDMLEASAELKKLKKELEQHENFLFDTAMAISKMSFEHFSAEMARARELFEQGKASEANEMLDFNVMKQHSDRNIANFEQGRERVMGDIEAYLLKTKTSMADETKPISERFTDASRAYEEAIDLARRVNMEPQKLAFILWYYASLLDSFNHFEEQLPLFREALALFRRLAEDRHEAYQLCVADMLHNIGLLNYNLHHYTDAESEIGEALDIYRTKSEKHPECQVRIVSALVNIGNLHNYLEKYHLAKEAFNEALRIVRDLGTDNSDEYLTQLAGVLGNLASVNNNIRKWNLAKSQHHEALEIYRSLAAKTPDIYLPRVATSLHNLGILYGNLGNDYLSEKNYCEALEIRRALAKKNPDAHLPALADTIHSIGCLHLKRGDGALVEREFSEAVDICRVLVGWNPQTYLPNLGLMLNDLAVLHHIDNKPALAEAEYDKALEIYRQLAEKDADTYQSYVDTIIESKKSLHEDYPIKNS